MKTHLRTHTCGELSEKNIGEEVTLCGWADSQRDHGGITFVDLRDRYGKTQLVIDPKTASFDGLTTLRTEECLQVTGSVRRRPNGTENPKISTGLIEISVQTVKLLSHCQTPPFEVTKSQDTHEDLRLEYRYLDLRNPAVQKNLFARHKVYQAIRRALDTENFVEVETPILTKSTPEGARDYLVPSRLNQGEFYALPQSPQLFKQILMVSGFDRYFQIAKCFRDEDLRADRQPEFTQLDMEMSFIKEEDIFGVVEKVVEKIIDEIVCVGARRAVPVQIPFPRLTYAEAMASYGTDKPDLRFDVKIQDVTDLVKNAEFKIFKEAAERPGGAVLGLCLPKAEASRKDIDALTEFAKAEGALGLAYFKVVGDAVGATGRSPIQLESPITKFFNESVQNDIIKTFNPSAGDLIVFAADERAKAQKVLGAIRLYAAKWKGWTKPDSLHFSWVTDFPLFKWNEEGKRWDSEHHPFTSPNMEDWAKYYVNSLDVRARLIAPLQHIRSSAYDLVLNGNEIASGSIRIHSRDLQREIFKTIGLDEKEAENRFGFLLKAFEFGPPPHGGIALGIDRVMAILLGLSSIREVIAFPKNQKAADPMTEAPSPVDEKQLKELGIKIR